MHGLGKWRRLEARHIEGCGRVALALLIAVTSALPGRAAQEGTAEQKLRSLAGLAGQERRQTLARLAASEGVVRWYGTYSLPEAEPFIQRFKERYSGISVEYFRASTAPLLDKVLAEASTGRLASDLVSIDLEALTEIEKTGSMGRYCSPEREFIDASFKDTNCLWTAMYHNPKVHAFNPRVLSRMDIPVAWEDLANPKWRGRLALPTAEGAQWAVSMLSIMGRDAGTAYLERMASQQVRLERSNSGTAQLVAAGDIPLGFMINVPAVGNLQRVGAPIASLSPQPLLTKVIAIFINKNADHPHAAALLLDHILSRDGQSDLMSISTRFTIRTDIPQRYAEVTEDRRVFLIGPEVINGPLMEEATRLFDRLFLRR